jgi:hypothetical protein
MVIDDLQKRLAAIEADLDAGPCRAGPWDEFVGQMHRRPSNERRTLAADVSRVSRKLHSGNGRRRFSASAGVGLELLATGASSAILAIGVARGWNLAVLTAAAVWVTTFQPLAKLLVGPALARIIRAGQREGSFRFGSARALATTVLACLDGLFLQELVEPGCTRGARGDLHDSVARLLRQGGAT